MVGQNVTEMIAEPTLARMLGATAHRIARTIHAHPTMNEGVMEAAEAALGRRYTSNPPGRLNAPLVTRGVLL